MAFSFFSLASGVEIGSYVVVVSSRISDGVTKCASGILKYIPDDRGKISDRVCFTPFPSFGG
jgi:hypothetical protein